MGDYNSQGLNKNFDLHEVVWDKQKIKRLWECYETTDIFKDEKFCQADFYVNFLKICRKYLPSKGKVLVVELDG